MSNISQSSALDTAQHKNPLFVPFCVLDSNFDDQIIVNDFDFDPDFELNYVRGLGPQALDLIKGHLRTDFSLVNDPPYIAASRGFSFLSSPGWFVPSTGYDAYQEFHFVAKVQEFAAGGYEVTITKQDLQALGRLMDAPRNTGPREKGEQNENDIVSSIARSKKKVRYLIKSMGCDRLLTFTKRESEGSEYWTVEQWAAAWKAFNKLCKRAGVDLQYVAVLERHKKGNYHLHAAIVG